MQRLQDINRVWTYIQREVEEEFGPGEGLNTDECVIAVLVVAALTKMLAEDDAKRDQDKTQTPRRRRSDPKG